MICTNLVSLSIVGLEAGQYSMHPDPLQELVPGRVVGDCGGLLAQESLPLDQHPISAGVAERGEHLGGGEISSRSTICG